MKRRQKQARRYKRKGNENKKTKTNKKKKKTRHARFIWTIFIVFFAMLFLDQISHLSPPLLPLPSSYLHHIHFSLLILLSKTSSISEFILSACLIFLLFSLHLSYRILLPPFAPSCKTPYTYQPISSLFSCSFFSLFKTIILLTSLHLPLSCSFLFPLPLCHCTPKPSLSISFYFTFCHFAFHSILASHPPRFPHLFVAFPHNSTPFPSHLPSLPSLPFLSIMFLFSFYFQYFPLLLLLIIFTHPFLPSPLLYALSTPFSLPTFISKSLLILPQHFPFFFPSLVSLCTSPPPPYCISAPSAPLSITSLSSPISRENFKNNCMFTSLSHKVRTN